LALIVRQTRENTPLIFVATGFGCLVVQKLMALEHADWILPISGVLFFDAPSPILKEKPKTEKVKTTPAPAAPAPTAPVAAAPDPTAPDTTAPVSTAFLSTFPAPANSARANRLRAILDSKGIDSWDLWEGFHLLINERGLPMVWFYNQAQLPKNVGAHSLLPRSPFPVWLYSRN
jgi:predicted alpha/beta hydrolase family esterase